MSSYLAGQIGEAYQDKELNYTEHKGLHVALGALMGAALNASTPLKGALAGASGALVAEIVAEALVAQHRATLNPLTPEDKEFYRNVSRLAATSFALMTDQNVSTALTTATNAVENNFMRQVLKFLIKAQKGAKEGVKQTQKTKKLKIEKESPGKTENKGLGSNPFQGKTPEQIDKILRERGFEPTGPDPLKGKGGYVNPKNKRSYHIDEQNRFNEAPHVDVNRPRNYKSDLEKRKYKM